MEQESTYKNIAIIGIGAAGGLSAVLLCKNPYNKVTAFDTKEPFATLLPTGGGRCNLTFDEDDLTEFVKNYPRGEKFLLSVFSKFNQKKTRELFKDLGVKTYVQKDKRVFPVSGSSKKTIQILQSHLKTSNFSLKKEKVTGVIKENDKFIIKTNASEYIFDYVILAAGGRSNGTCIAENLGHNIIPLKPSLCALDIKEKNFYKLAGISFKDVEINAKFDKKKFYAQGDILFAHKFITGPVVFKLSALSAYYDFNADNPLTLNIKLTDSTIEDIENEINSNHKKSIKNVFSKFAPTGFISEILNVNQIDGNKQTCQMKKSEKEILINSLLDFELHAVNKIKDSEIVTAGGVDLKEVNSKTMESKLVKNFFIIGEVLDIDGYTGGFNLQNCWSCAYICSLNFN